jgi:hypothetical protein
VQSGPVRVWRDNNHDSIVDYGGVEHTGQFGINIHRAGEDSKLVEGWSAGCQVFKRNADFESLLAICRKQASRGPGWGRFSYSLIHLRDAPDLAHLALPA